MIRNFRILTARDGPLIAKRGSTLIEERSFSFTRMPTVAEAEQILRSAGLLRSGHRVVLVSYINAN